MIAHLEVSQKVNNQPCHWQVAAPSSSDDDGMVSCFIFSREMSTPSISSGLYAVPDAMDRVSDGCAMSLPLCSSGDLQLIPFKGLLRSN